VNPDLRRALAAGAGVVRGSRLGLPRHVLGYALRAGHVVSLHPGVYAAAATAADFVIRARAALAWLGESASLSHTTALAIWGLLPPDPMSPIHATIPIAVRRHGGRGLIVHRRRGAVAGVIRRGLVVTRLDSSIVDAWPILSPDSRRGPVISAVTGRRTTVPRLRAEVAGLPQLAGRKTFLRLLDLLAAGCHSPLEMWGLEHVFVGPGMPVFERQRRIDLGGHVVYLDVYAPIERVDFELDGSMAHARAADRERDMRRDAALAAVGILVVRFSYRRLTREAAAVRDEVRAILATRRRAA
jgi:very-short-patch-repair endonuclease